VKADIKYLLEEGAKQRRINRIKTNLKRYLIRIKGQLPTTLKGSGL